MIFQQVELPKDKAPTPDQEWGWTFKHFLADNFWYLLAVAVIILIFFFARYSYRKRYLEKGND